MGSDNSAKHGQYEELQPSEVGLFWPEGWKDPQAETPFRRLLRLMEARPFGVDLSEWDNPVREAGYAHPGQVHSYLTVAMAEAFSLRYRAGTSLIFRAICIGTPRSATGGTEISHIADPLGRTRLLCRQYGLTKGPRSIAPPPSCWAGAPTRWYPDTRALSSQLRWHGCIRRDTALRARSTAESQYWIAVSSIAQSPSTSAQNRLGSSLSAAVSD